MTSNVKSIPPSSLKTSSPLKRKFNSVPKAARPTDHVAVKKEMADEVFDLLVGGMPPSEFMQQFLPLKADLPKRIKEFSASFFASVPSTNATLDTAAITAEQEDEEDGADVEVLVEDEDEEDAVPPVGQAGAKEDDDMETAIFKEMKKKFKRERHVLEKHMYKHLIPLIRDANILGGDLDVYDTSGHADANSNSQYKWKPDLSFYIRKALRRLVDSRPHTQKKKSKKPVLPNQTFFDILQLPVEIKTAGQTKPFTDAPAKLKGAAYRKHIFQTKSDGARETRGQLMTVLTEMCARQHRTHAFMLFIGDPEARLIRADRAGVIVSRAFDFRKEGQTLAEFLYRFSMLSDVERGMDPTVRPATSTEEKRAYEHLQKWKPMHDRPVVVIDVPNSKTGEIRKVLAWGSLSDADSLTGRATRGYPVCDLENGTDVYFLKDTWRPDVDDIESETQILEELNAAKVEHIPTLICGGDVAGQKTRTQDFVDKEWTITSSEDLCGRQHHRLLEDFAGQCVEQIENPLRMMEIVRDAFKGHQMAYAYGFLHRDISHNNVRIRKLEDGTFEGVLSDWDLAIRVRHPDGKPIEFEGARQPARTGTWYFMSSALCQRPRKYHELQDDFESFFYLILYLALSQYPFTIFTPRSIKCLEDQIFGEYTRHREDEEELSTGGNVKGQILTNPRGCILAGLKFVDNEPLTTWYYVVRAALEAHTHIAYGLWELSQSEVVSVSSERLQLQEDFKKLQLYDHTFLAAKFEEYIARPGWPDCPPEATISQEPQPVAGTSKSSSKRRKLGDDDDYKGRDSKTSRSATDKVSSRLRPRSGQRPSGSTTSRSTRVTRSATTPNRSKS